MFKLGVCPVCQQSGINVKRVTPSIGDQELYAHGMEGDEIWYALWDHNHQGGELCEGGGDTPQAVYNSK